MVLIGAHSTLTTRSCGLPFFVKSTRDRERGASGATGSSPLTERERGKNPHDYSKFRVQRASFSPGHGAGIEVVIGGDAPDPKTETGEGAVATATVTERETEIEIAVETETETGGEGEKEREQIVGEGKSR